MVKQMAGLPTLIFVGSGYDKDNKTISPSERDEIRQKILVKAAEIFGGVTILDADGAWIDDSGRLIEERIFQIIVYSHRTEGDHHASQWAGFIRFILNVSRQTSVLVDDRSYPEAYLVFFDSFETHGIEHA